MTPLDIEILLHYYCSSEDFPRMNAPAVVDSIRHFSEMGLLKYDDAKGRYTGNREALEVYVKALTEVPLPVNKWIIPNNSY